MNVHEAYCETTLNWHAVRILFDSPAFIASLFWINMHMKDASNTVMMMRIGTTAEAINPIKMQV